MNKYVHTLGQLLRLCVQIVLAFCVILIASFVGCKGPSHTYLDQGRYLGERLVDILVEEKICASKSDCQKGNGPVFGKHLANGTQTTIYGIQSEQVAARLLAECASSFANRPLGTEMSAEIFQITKTEQMSELPFQGSPPTFTLKLEKNHVKH